MRRRSACARDRDFGCAPRLERRLELAVHIAEQGDQLHEGARDQLVGAPPRSLERRLLEGLHAAFVLAEPTLNLALAQEDLRAGGRVLTEFVAVTTAE